MSAWIVSKVHIDLMVKAIRHGTANIGIFPTPMTDGQADQLGQLLVNENVTSVRYRYPNDKPGEEPGPCDGYYLVPYKFTDHGYTPTAAEFYSLVSCYQYQSCEHPAWEKSKVNVTLNALMDGLCERVPKAKAYRQDRSSSVKWPERDACPWGWDAEDLEKRTTAVQQDHRSVR